MVNNETLCPKCDASLAIGIDTQGDEMVASFVCSECDWWDTESEVPIAQMGDLIHSLLFHPSENSDQN